MRWQVLLLCFAAVAVSAGPAIGKGLGKVSVDSSDVTPVVVISRQRRSLTETLTMWMEEMFEMVLRKAEKMVDKLPVGAEQQQAMKRSMSSFGSRVSTISNRIGNNVVNAWKTFLLFGVLPLVPLDYLPEPMAESIREWGRIQWAGGDKPSDKPATDVAELESTSDIDNSILKRSAIYQP